MPFLRSNKISRQAFNEVLLLLVPLAPLFACQTKENQPEWKINEKCKPKEVQEEEIIKKFNSLITNCRDQATGQVPPPMCLSQIASFNLQIKRVQGKIQKLCRIYPSAEEKQCQSSTHSFIKQLDKSVVPDKISLFQFWYQSSWITMGGSPLLNSLRETLSKPQFFTKN